MLPGHARGVARASHKRNQKNPLDRIIEAARAAKRFPRILDLLIDGDVTLTAITLLAPHLTNENCGAALAAARHKSKREVEAQIAALRPLPPVAPSIRKVSIGGLEPASEIAQKRHPERTVAPPAVSVPALPPPVSCPVPKPPFVKPLSPQHYKLQFTVSAETHAKLRRVQDLLRHSIPDGDPAKIFDRALTLLLAEIEKKKLAAAAKPRQDRPPHSAIGRHIPASVRRAVWKRDGGRCAFVGNAGRCDERGFLEFHHRQPFAAGGATTAENLELRCRAHNAYEAELFFGPSMARETREDYDAPRTRSGPSCSRWPPRAMSDTIGNSVGR